MSMIFDKLLSTYSRVSDALTFNAATLSGAIDIIIVKHDDGSMVSTPFHVRFGKLQLLKSREKLVTLTVNGVKADFVMKLGQAGEAFFVMDAKSQRPASEEELQSPLGSPAIIPQPAAVFTTNKGTVTTVKPAQQRHSNDNNKSKLPHLDLTSHNYLSPPSSPARRELFPANTQHSRINSVEVEERTNPNVIGVSKDALDEEEKSHSQRHSHSLSAPISSQPASPRSPVVNGRPATANAHLTFSTPQPPSPQTRRSTSMDSPFTAPPSLRSALTLGTPFAPSLDSPRSPASPRMTVDDRTVSAPSASDAFEHAFTWHWGNLPVHAQKHHHMQPHPERFIHKPGHTHSHSVSSIVANGTSDSGLLDPDEMKSAIMQELKSEAADALNELHGNAAVTANPDADHRRSWSVRGIFTSVFSKLPGGSAITSPRISSTPTTVESPSQLIGEMKESQSTASPSDSINIDEAHVSLPWLTNATLDTSNTGAENNSNNQTFTFPPSHASTTVGASSTPPASFLRPNAVTAHELFGSPLSAPINASRSVPSLNRETFKLPQAVRIQHSNQQSQSIYQATQAQSQSLAATLPASLIVSVDPISQSTSASNSAAVSPAFSSNVHSPQSSALSVSPSLSIINDSSGAGGEQPLPPALSLSLCGELLGSNASINRELFATHEISYSTLTQQPELAFRSDLVVLYNGKLFPSRIALPLILSQLAFQRPIALTQEAIERLASISLMPGQQPVNSSLSLASEQSVSRNHSTSTIIDASISSPNVASRSSSWLSWFRYKKPPPIDTEASQKSSLTIPVISQSQSLDSLSQAAATALPLESHPSQQSVAIDSPSSASSNVNTGAGASVAPINNTHSNGDSNPVYVKSLRPTSEMLQSLNLRPGRNSVVFTVNSSLQGEQTVSAAIYLWTPTTKIVISDIDGTITKSDILGHVMPLVGRDWSHIGVVKLYNDIVRNGYEILYLTSRAIGQAGITRGYIQSLKQGEALLPAGPILLSPDRLLHSFRREIIERKPHEFKIVALRDVRMLFDDDYCPFYSGFGNRITDVIAYRTVGVPKSRIFIVDPSSAIAHTNRHYRINYTELSKLVSHMFPSLLNQSLKGSEEFNDFNFWKSEIAPLSEEEDSSEDSDELDDSKELNDNIEDKDYDSENEDIEALPLEPATHDEAIDQLASEAVSTAAATINVAAKV